MIQGQGGHMHHFVSQLRARTHYPTYRAFVNVGLAIGYLLAVAVIFAALLAMNEGFGALLLGFAIAAVVVVLAHLGREVALMAADAADALLNIAGRSEEDEPPAKVANQDWRDER